MKKMIATVLLLALTSCVASSPGVVTVDGERYECKHAHSHVGGAECDKRFFYSGQQNVTMECPNGWRRTGQHCKAKP